MLSTLAKSAVRPSVSKVVRIASLATAAAKPAKKDAKAPESDSFCMNLFRGRAVIDQVFPYPLKLDDDHRETLHLITGPVEKFLEEVNDVNK
ncbi:hypothetical protein ANCCAN_10319 [Ancylostoma caninum]|uniref:Uncharacterized protein n=1 Tax=Ancylostoma caninum TaxID=29170 RepID=A0A368GL06_ANCCA|nr:hypothetical protein ANCCAN_10319 [Ancylostoma caninum]